MFDPITGLYPGYIGHPHPIKGQQTNNSFTQAVDAVAKSCYRALISTTSLLPLSKRGLVFNIIRAPIFIPLRFFQLSKSPKSPSRSFRLAAVTKAFIKSP